MKILLSPAKSLDYESLLPTTKKTKARFIDQAFEINHVLKSRSEKEIAQLMHISSNLANLNFQRYASFQREHGTRNSRPAIFAFAGDVYTGFDAYSMTEDQIQEAQGKVRILSGLYGLLRPLDLLQPYRLEMGTKLSIDSHKNLYDYWKEMITTALNKEMKKNELLVNLASNEYFKVIDLKNQKGHLIAPVFKDFKNGKLKIISFYAKKARGLMARHLVNQAAEKLEHVLSFKEDGYAFSQEHTLKDSEPVFIR
jgi:hypothetical protein